MKKKFPKYIIITLLFILFCKKKESDKVVVVEENYNSKNYVINEYYSLKDNLLIRELPNSNSKVITSLKKCEKVSEVILESEKNYYEESEGEKNFINIISKKGLNGFVSKNEIKPIDKDSRSPYIFDLEFNHEPFNIIRIWAFYLDDPNIIIQFDDDNKGILESSFNVDEDGNMIITHTNFKYSYDGCCKVITYLEDGRILEFDIIKFENTKTILLNCMYADPDYKL
jgi:hypothetical protein